MYIFVILNYNNDMNYNLVFICNHITSDFNNILLYRKRFYLIADRIFFYSKNLLYAKDKNLIM